MSEDGGRTLRDLESNEFEELSLEEMWAIANFRERLEFIAIIFGLLLMQIWADAIEDFRDDLRDITPEKPIRQVVVDELIDAVETSMRWSVFIVDRITRRGR